MRKILSLLTLGLGLSFGACAADAPAKAPTAQQNKMVTCNKEAGDRKGEERKSFMKDCLGAKKATQQDKMKACNKEATGKKGDERKAFIGECLKK